MLFSIVLLIVAFAFLMFYFQATCDKILLRAFEGEFFHGVANANRLSFSFVRKALEEFDVPGDYWRFRMQLKCDFLALNYLLKNAKQRFSKEEMLLRMYFEAVLFALWIRHQLGLSEKAAVLKLTSILEYFANVLGERRSWKAEIDVMVEDNGTVFLVYPLSDAARDWFDMNMLRNTQRLGDIQFVEPRHLNDLVAAILDSGLTVVWSSYSLTLRNSRRKVREKDARSVSR